MVDARRAVGVLRHDDGGGAGLGGHLLDLDRGEVVGGEEHGDLPLLHQRDDLLTCPGVGGMPGLASMYATQVTWNRSLK